MRKRIMWVFLMYFCGMFILGASFNNENTVEPVTATSEAYIPSEITTSDARFTLYAGVGTIDQELDILLEGIEHERQISNDKEVIKELLDESAKRVESVQAIMLRCNNENYPMAKFADTQLQNAEEDYEFYNQQYQAILLEEEQQKWADRMEEYPEATTVWLFLDEKGFNDYVKAGILGNMMTEVGGQTLQLDIDANSNGYYGICQWKRSYYPEVINASLDGQLDFLLETIEYEFDVYGTKCYKAGFDYNDFITLKDEQVAALAFAETYERCNPSSNNQRQQNATVAYEYFTQ